MWKMRMRWLRMIRKRMMKMRRERIMRKRSRIDEEEEENDYKKMEQEK